MRRDGARVLFTLSVLWLISGCPSTKHPGTSAGNDGGGSQVTAGNGASGGSGATGGSGTGSTGHDAGAGQPAVDGGGHITDAGGGCVRGGCSSELCVEASAPPVVSDCIFRPEFACYQKATCERQAGGSCGFTPTQTLTACLASAAGDAAMNPSGLTWHETCGAPVCSATPFDDPSVTNCVAQKAGAPCTQSGDKCDLVNGCRTQLSCASTDPKTQGCPRSRAHYKQDISYLTPAQRERVYHDLLTIPLASYEYKDDPNAVPQLGFLLEDVEPSPATRGDRVNLYGYLSMAVAAVQVQAQQIDALKREVEALRRQPRPAAVSCEP